MSSPAPLSTDQARSAAVVPGHGHLWVLADGTPAHAPPGRLSVGADGRLACHLCGEWFAHLGLHLRRHGWTAGQYRDAVGLTASSSLCSQEISARIAGRQRRNYRSQPAARARLRPGQQMAASGELAALAAGAGSPAAAAARADAAGRGRAAMRARRGVELENRLRQLGFTDLAGYLRHAYGTGSSLEDLAQATGLGRARLRAEVVAAGVVIRPSGVNDPARKRARAGRNDTAVAARLGVADVRSWLRQQQAAGASLADLSALTGRSVPWVRQRLGG